MATTTSDKEKNNKLLVKYSNVMNEISLKDLNKRELNLFMFLFAKAKNEGSNEIKIPLEHFVKTLDPEGNYLTSREKIKKAIKSTYDKTDKLYTIDTDKDFTIFHLLNYAKYVYETDSITYQVNSEFLRILNDFGKDNPFTQFELERFLKLESKHSKNLYRQLMQWKKTGEMDIDIEDFKFRMELSASYTPRDIMQKVIKPSIEELLEKGYFAELRVEPKKSWGRGGKINGYVFYFKECVNDEMPGQQVLAIKGEDGEVKFRTKSNKPKKTQVDFEQNNYDFKALEEKLLNQ